MEEEGAGAITDEQRAEVIQILFEFLRAHGSDISEGTEVFRYLFTGKIGKVRIDFEIGQEFADWAIETSRGLTERIFDSLADKLKAKGELEESAKVHITPDNHHAALLAYFTMQGMIGKLKNAFFELGLEAEKVYEGFVLNVMKEHPTFTKEFQAELPNILDDVRALSKSMATERRQYLSAQISSFKHKPQLDRLPELYPMLLKVWQSAKKIYDQNSESETWRDMVKAKSV